MLALASTVRWIGSQLKRTPSQIRNKDLRLTDNRALAEASATAINLSLPLIVLHIFSPSDYASHDRSARRIDFQLRSMALLRTSLNELNIPLYSVIWEDRKLIPERLEGLLGELGAKGLFANLEYEVDELRRDMKVVENLIGARKGERKEGWKGQVTFMKDFTVVPPNEIVTLVRSFPSSHPCLVVSISN